MHTIRLTDTPPAGESVLASLDEMILSASGWRKVFAADRDEESISWEITREDGYLAGLAALVFSRFLREADPDARILVLAMDARFTGPAIAEYMFRVFSALQWEVRCLSIAPVPEVIAYLTSDASISGCAYISASHNPVGHNGMKFIAASGVIGGNDSARLIRSMRDACTNAHALQEVHTCLHRSDSTSWETACHEESVWKQHAEDAYRQFIGLTASGSFCTCTVDDLYNRIRSSLSRSPMGIVIDFNGSARTRSIDVQLLESIGIRVRTINEKPRQIAHPIIPEGENLIPCARALEEAWRTDPSFSMGYLPDNDGDRGNIVIIDEATGEAKPVEAQELFALVTVSELSYLVQQGVTEGLAVVVNGPTSMRIDEIARFFNAEVFRSEVGEANVVELARIKRREGCIVRILGEGSNGGNITHPSVVRDPLNTLLSLVKLLALRDTPNSRGLAGIWRDAAGLTGPFPQIHTLQDIPATLPAYITTGVTEERALMHLSTRDQSSLKAEYERRFLYAWERERDLFREQFGICSWKAVQYEGTAARDGIGPGSRSQEASGGLKIIFYDDHGRETDFIWMRGSKTEPVFRVMADCKGSDAQREASLLNWHRMLIQRAETSIQA